MDPNAVAKLFITVVITLVSGFVAVYGTIKSDGTYLAFALAGLSLLGLMWGPPGAGKKD